MADSRGNIFWYNRRWYEYTGTTPEEVRAWGRQAVHHPDHISRVMEIVTRSFLTGEPMEATFPLRGKDGAYRWFLSRAIPIRDREGKIVRWFGTNTDIHEQKIEEDELRRDQGRFQTAARAAGITVAELDTTHRYRWIFNPHPDFPVEKVIGRKDLEILPREAALSMRAAREQVMRSGEVVHADVEIPLSDGVHRYELIIEPVKNMHGDVTGIISTRIDVTEKKRLEAELISAKEQAESRARDLDAAFACAGEGMVIIAADGSIRRINAAAKAILAYTDEEERLPVNERTRRLAERTIWIDEHTGEAISMTSGQLPILKALREGGTVPYEFLIRSRADGSEHWITGVSSPIRGTDGSIIGAISTFLDISDRKRSEGHIRTLLSEKELLLKEVHHRIKNNMNTMRSLLSLQAQRMNAPAAAQALWEAEGRMTSMNLLYDKLYRTSDFREIPVREYFSELVEEIAGVFPNRSRVSIETHVEEISLDSKRLSPLGMILNELLTNSMKYAFTGRDHGRILIWLSGEKGSGVLQFEDNGVGLPHTVLEGKSSGFDLELVRMLAMQLGGRADFENAQGTRITVRFGGRQGFR